MLDKETWKIGTDHGKMEKLIKQHMHFFKIWIHSMEGWRVTTRHGDTRKRSTKRLKHTGNLFRKNQQLKDAF